MKKLAGFQEPLWFNSGRQQGIPAEWLALANHILTAQKHLAKSLQAPRLERSHLCTEEEHRHGAPLLPLIQFTYDAPSATRLFLDFLRFAETCPSVKTPAKAFPAYLEASGGVPSLLDALLAQDLAPFERAAQTFPSAPHLALVLACNTLFPWLEATARAVTALAPLSGSWNHGTCPVCGSPVFFGHLAKPSPNIHGEQTIDKGGARFHTCVLCHTSFRVNRLQCPFCLEEDTSKLAQFSSKALPEISVHVCHSCNSYIKIADFRERIEGTPNPVLEDLLSLPLDLAAQARGFERPTFSEWGLG